MSNVSPLAEGFSVTTLYPTTVPIEGTAETPVGGKFKIPLLAERMGDSENTLFLDPEMRTQLGLGEYLLRSRGFIPRPDWSIGREASVQQVFFGELILNVDKGFSGEEVDIPVAVKPYHTAKRNAVHEYVGFGVVNGLSCVESFHPLGFWVDSSGKTFLLTRFEEDVVTFDNINWEKGDEDPLSQHYGPFSALGFSARIIARLHSNGFSHRDAQIQNLAEGNSGTRIADLTTLVRFMSPEIIDPALIRKGVVIDLKKLIESVNRQGYLAESDRERRYQIITSNLIAPYLSMIRHPSSGIDYDVQQEVDFDGIVESLMEII